jgi:hypothetical protein
VSRVSDAARALIAQRWAKMTAAERSTMASKLAAARWAGMTPEERSAEMKRRRRKVKR